MSPQVDLKNFTLKELEDWVESIGESRFRGKQIIGWLYRPNIKDFFQMTDLGKKFRKTLSEKACISSFEQPVVEEASDGCIKFAFRLHDDTTIESVLIPEKERNTLCISSQVGCAMGCKFCLTGTMGFTRNLQVSEIVNQVCAARDFLLSQPAVQRIGPERITNVVYMGMGEPLNNLDNVLASLSLLNEQKGLDIATRKITVSTCGIIPRMQDLGENSSANLAVSLHSVRDAVRSRLMPINQKYSVDALIAACREYPMRRRKRIMFEYTLLKGINDSDEDARMLAKTLRGLACKINLISYNECPQLPYQSPDEDRVLAFQKILLDAHYTAFIRSSRGAEISAACGQLATQKSITSCEQEL